LNCLLGKTRFCRPSKTALVCKRISLYFKMPFR
jgi:hypothetical protein